MLKCILYVVLFVLKYSFCVETNPIININDGKIQGVLMKTLDERNFYAFRGIPYAKPPVDKLRFKAPQPIDKWDNTLDCTKEANICAQVLPFGNDTFIGSEDCLYLNVYTPVTELELIDKFFPIIIFIHGGANYFGDGGIYENGPEFLLDYDIILVTLNYRIGPFGFLSTGNQLITGNFALKDQVMALKWVQNNINIFGGDKTKVTLHGYSAGAALVQAHLFSRMSKGLFHRAIIQSGNENSGTLFRNNPKKHFFVFASFVGCDGYDSLEAAVECVIKKPTEKLVQAIYDFPHWVIKIPLIYNPVVEKKSLTEEWTEEPFLTKKYKTMINKKQIVNDVPIITGFTSDEFGAFGQIVAENKKHFIHFNLHFDKVATVAFNLHNLNEKYFIEVRKFYFGKDTVTNKLVGNLSNLYSDTIVNWGQIDLAKHLTNSLKSNVYFYLFTYMGRLTEAPNNYKRRGAFHCDDLGYIFRRKKSFPNGKPNNVERKLIKMFGKIFYNFASTGKPMPNKTDDKLFDDLWLPLPKNLNKALSNFNYLEISNTIKMHEDEIPFSERMKFWNKIYYGEKFYKDEL